MNQFSRIFAFGEHLFGEHANIMVGRLQSAYVHGDVRKGTAIEYIGDDFKDQTMSAGIYSVQPDH